MIADLLKQFSRALGEFFRYHTLRILRRPDRLQAAPPAVPAPDSTAPAAAVQAQIPPVNEDIGLDPEYQRPVQWPRHRTSPPPEEVASGALFKLWSSIPGGTKWSHYFPVFESIFGPRRAEPLRVLEIGVFYGASLQLWRRYLTNPGTILVGIDINPDCLQYAAPSQGIHVRIGSQIDAAFLATVVDEFGPFDLIIDDGSHQSSHIIATFNILFAGALRDTGIYFVEDLHTGYWDGWRDSNKSFLDVCKELVEHMHAHYRSASAGTYVVKSPSAQPDTAVQVPKITTMIQEIRFYDSMVAIYKARRGHVPYIVNVGSC